MPLIEETTNLKSLRYGKDRIGGGNSNQPYIKSNIPDGERGLGRTGGPDFLLRGGLLTPGRVIDDVSRLTQMFFDTKSPNGLLFTAKQNILSRTAVATNGDGKALNEGIYLPTSTILQAAGNPFGIHLNKQGLDPTKRTGPNAGQNGLFDLLGITDPLGLPIYTELVKKDSDSRLTRYLTTKYPGNATELYSYSGGPGSVLGVGRTSIPIYKERTNTSPNYKQESLTLSEFTLSNNLSGISYNPSKYTDSRPKLSEEEQNRRDNLKYKWGATTKYFSIAKDPSQFNIINSSLGVNGQSNTPNSVYKPGTLDNYDTKTVDIGNTLTQQQLIESSGSRFNPKIQEDFRKKATKTSFSLDYTNPNQRLEGRVNLGNPGEKGNISNYILGKEVAGKREALDKINALTLYKSEGVTTNKVKNDLVKFRIGVIDNEDPSLKTYIHFRAFLDSMSDSYTSDWQAQKYMGRGENFYRYNGFDRGINLSWTVAAQSKEELIPMYQKLNYLASVCAPDYSKTGYMRGNLITLTVGGYLYEQVGIMKGITYDVPQESPWEIAVPIETNLTSIGTGENQILSDSTVKELPHIIKVTGFQFIPIHNFVPRVQQINPETKGVITELGKERYIALQNESGEALYDPKSMYNPGGLT